MARPTIKAGARKEFKSGAGGAEEPRTKLELTTELPPSTNNLYQRRRGGQLALTDTAQRLRIRVKQAVVDRLGKVMAFPTDPELIYRFDMIAYFESLENPGWFERYGKDTYGRSGELKHHKGERKAKTRYKRIDVDNRIKFLQDCVSKAIGIPDDAQIFVGYQEKREDPHNPRVEITVSVEQDPDRFFSKRRR
jgi:hypothetical protein